MYQQITIVGNLGSDPEMKYMPQGDAVTQFSVAANRHTGSGDTRTEQTTWFRVSVWGRSAEACNKYLARGSSVLVVGSLVPDKDTGGPRVFQRSDGTAGAAYDVRADSVQFLGRADRSDDAPAKAPAKAQGDLPF